MTSGRRRGGTLTSAALATFLLTLALLAATIQSVGAPAEAHAAGYSSPSDVPDPFQDYTARDYADALWNLETQIRVRTHEREDHGDCQIQTYTATDPLDPDDVRTYAQVISADDSYCSGEDGDQLREELDDQAADEEDFFHGRPYELARENEDSRPFEVLRERYYGDWADITGSGVTSRVAIHARDTGSSTWTASGTYYSHYTGERVNIGTTETHGEHMVPVSYTWPELQHASAETRRNYYNDPMNLTSAIGWVNREKSGKTPHQWMPENRGAWCAYATTWVHISQTYGLSLYQSDITTLREVLWECYRNALPTPDDDGARELTSSRSGDLDWGDPAPAPQRPEDESQRTYTAEGPRDHYTLQDYHDAVFTLENHIPVRVVDREEHGDCDVLTTVSTHPRTGEKKTSIRITTPENTACEDEDIDEDDLLDGDAELIPTLEENREEKFGTWDQDGNGVTTADQVLARDAQSVSWSLGGETIKGAVFHDPHTGESHEVTGSEEVSEQVRANHIVPVGHAWPELAVRSQQTREEFFNDQQNLIAVSTESAAEKSGNAPRNWMPEHTGFHCRYATAWVEVLAQYRLSAHASDIRELRNTLYRCMAADEQEAAGESGAAADPGARREGASWISLAPQPQP